MARNHNDYIEIIVGGQSFGLSSTRSAAVGTLDDLAAQLVACCNISSLASLHVATESALQARMELEESVAGMR